MSISKYEMVVSRWPSFRSAMAQNEATTSEVEAIKKKSIELGIVYAKNISRMVSQRLQVFQ